MARSHDDKTAPDNDEPAKTGPQFHGSQDPRTDRDPNRPANEPNLSEGPPAAATHDDDGRPTSDLIDPSPPVVRPNASADPADYAVNFDDLRNHVATIPNVQEATTTLLGEVAAHLRAAADRGDLATIRRLADDFSARSDELARAVLAGTPINPDPAIPGRTPNPPEMPRR